MKYLCSTRWIVILCLSIPADAQVQQIKLVKDIYPGKSFHSSPNIHAGLNDGSILFSANDNTVNKNIWRSDGTAAGTYRLPDSIAGPSGGMVPSRSILVNDKIYFSRQTDQYWVSDGTNSGMFQALDDSFHFHSGGMATYNGILYFSGSSKNSLADDVWCSDGTLAGTYKFKDKCPNYTEGAGRSFIVAMGKLFFVAKSDAHGNELWVTDGTNAGTHMVKDLYPGYNNSGVLSDLHLYKGRIYFRGKEGKKALCNIYSADTNSITLLKSINTEENSGASIFQPLSDDMVIVNDRLMFCIADTSNNVEVWSTDGTDTGTHMMVDVNGNFTGSTPIFSGVVNNKLIFSGAESYKVRNLWASDGTAAGTHVINKAYVPTRYGDITILPTGYKLGAVYKDSLLYYVANDTTHGQELWVTDGTAAGTRLIQDKALGGQGIYISQLFMHGDNLWMCLNDQVHGYELFILDASLPLTVKKVASIESAFAKVYPNPNTGSFSVELNKRGFKNGYLKVTDINGRTIYDQSIAHGTQQLPVTLSNTPVGVYMVTVQLDGETMTQSIVVQ